MSPFEQVFSNSLETFQTKLNLIFNFFSARISKQGISTTFTAVRTKLVTSLNSFKILCSFMAIHWLTFILFNRVVNSLYTFCTKLLFATLHVIPQKRLDTNTLHTAHKITDK